MKPEFVDVHTHTQFTAFKDDRGEVIKRALDNNVWLINVGSQKDTSKKAVEITKQYSEGVYATVGLHPIHIYKGELYNDPQEIETVKELISQEEEFDYDYYRNLALNSKVVAIGECGLDFYRITNNESRIKNLQEEIFIKHIKLAKELKKPLMIHCRPSQGSSNAYDDLYQILKIKTSDISSTIIHFFAGSLELAKKFLDLGCYFTFGGVITFGDNYDEVVKCLPLERVLIETDAPYVAPVPFRGKRNEPLYVKYVAQKLAQIKNLDLNKVAEITTKNALEIFKL